MKIPPDFFSKQIITADDLRLLGWRSSTEVNVGRGERKTLYLCPESQFHLIPEGTVLTDVIGKEIKKNFTHEKGEQLDVDEEEGFTGRVGRRHMAVGLLVPWFNPKFSRYVRSITEPFEPAW